ncbi:MAG: glycosyltransferase family 39 protein, partial [Planctomycetota bacterium]
MVILLLLGALPRVYQLGEDGLWYDEAATWRYSHMSLQEQWMGEGRREANPPGFYTLQKAWHLFGDSEASLRSLACLFGVLMVPLSFGLVKSLTGNGPAWVTALLVASSAELVCFSQEARTFTAVACVAVGLFWLLAWLWRDPGQATRCRDPRVLAAWLGYGTLATVGLYLHNTFFVIPGVATLLAVVWWMVWGKRSIGFVALWAAVNALVLLAWMFWLPTVFYQAFVRTIHWLPAAEGSHLTEVAHTVFGLGWVDKRQPWIDLCVAALAFWGLWTLRKRPVALLVLGGFGVLAPLIVLAVSQATPMWQTRVLLWVMVPWLGLVGIGIARLPGRVLTAIVTVGLVGLQARSILVYYDHHEKADWHAATQYIQSEADPQDLLLFLRADYETPYAFYLDWQEGDPTQPRRLAIGTADWHLKAAHAVLKQVPQRRVADLLDHYDRIWLVSWHKRPGWLKWFEGRAEIVNEQRFTNAII